ncbi:beta-eliminating lyase-related protein [Paracoccus sp. TK19116]|uniref:Beta-eliminating lyase-related protein n=1 Tax=Paracoccus albicereus TaxID=2922394 RepID=A0ABT1MTI3_9RHOB|nr:beta-eliminating lyase-related protein [Paracoccus albicereus]MCQ0971638.1 beta-eliminating lyase-related protein [Paracoccus albicereus]
MNFGSDNASGVHPAIMDALAAANQGHASGYGRDPLTEEAVERVRAVFEAPRAEIFFVGVGTASNALALAQLCPPFGRIFCHRGAHIETSESGAPGFMAGGAQMALIDGADGRVTPAALNDALATYPQDDEHDGLNAVLSLSNATEMGTVYAPERIAPLTAIAHAQDMAVHMDGARFANAVASTGASPAELTWRSGVDALSLGGTKDGCMALEAVILFDPDRARHFSFRRMRAGHLWSKHRFLAAQMLAWLDDELWLRLAGHANAKARTLSHELTQISFAEILNPVEANEIFVRLPQRRIEALRKGGLRAADWPMPGDSDTRMTIRLVTSWATTEAEITALVAALRR